MPQVTYVALGDSLTADKGDLNAGNRPVGWARLLEQHPRLDRDDGSPRPAMACRARRAAATAPLRAVARLIRASRSTW